MATDADFQVTAPVLNPGESFLVRYKLANASSFSQLTPNPTGQDFTIPNLSDGCYEFEIQKVKAGGEVCAGKRTGTFCIGETCCTPNITSVTLYKPNSTPPSEPRLLRIYYDLASCDPAPDLIRIYYREGSTGPYANNGAAYGTPLFAIPATGSSTCEGYIVGVCNGEESPIHVPFQVNEVANELRVTYTTNETIPLIRVQVKQNGAGAFQTAYSDDYTAGDGPIVRYSTWSTSGVDAAPGVNATYQLDISPRKFASASLNGLNNPSAVGQSIATWTGVNGSPKFVFSTQPVGGTTNVLHVVRLSGAGGLGTICGAGPQPIYTLSSHPVITDGVALYLDEGCTVLIDESIAYVVESAGGTIYNVSNGVVTFATSSTC